MERVQARVWARSIVKLLIGRPGSISYHKRIQKIALRGKKGEIILVYRRLEFLHLFAIVLIESHIIVANQVVALLA